MASSPDSTRHRCCDSSANRVERPTSRRRGGTCFASPSSCGLDAREKPTNALGQARMLLPVRSGWVPANETILGRGWGGTEGESGELFEAFVDGCAGLSETLDEVAGKIVLGPEVWTSGMRDTRVSVAFLVACGVAHGLPVIAAPRLKLRGEDVNARAVPGWVTVRGLSSGERSTWLEAAKHRATGTVSYATTEYTSDPLVLADRYSASTDSSTNSNDSASPVW